jgi:hypothetical protein
LAASLQFEIKLNQLIMVGEGPARAITCLEATCSNSADIYLFWLAVTAWVKEALVTAGLPDAVCGEICSIINHHWCQLLIDGPTNVHLATFYLNPSESSHRSMLLKAWATILTHISPGYVWLNIFKVANALSLSIMLPSQEARDVPLGIQSPKTFKEVRAYLLSLMITKINNGVNDSFTAWKGQGKAFIAAYQA